LISWVLRNRAVLTLGALLIAGAVAAQTLADHDTKEGPPLSSHDSRPGGSLALALWLERLGYVVERLESGSSADLAGNSMLFILEPIREFSRLEGEAILSWVRRGGALVYVPGFVATFEQISPELARDVLNDQIGITVPFGPHIQEARATLPFFTAPLASLFLVDTRRSVSLQDEAWVPLIAEEGRVVAATRPLDGGRVYVATSDALLSNHGIGQGDNPAFVLNILARHPDVRTVVFEEAHHAPVEAPGLMGEMRATPWGWAVIYASVLTAVFLFWAGRRFGPPVATVREPARSTGEYVSAFAGLLQRTRATAWTQGQLAQAFRRRLARQLGVRAELSAADMADLLADRYTIDEETFAGSLNALDGAPLDERQLLTHVRGLEEVLRGGRVEPPSRNDGTNPGPQGP